MERIAAMLAENEEVTVETGCFSDNSGCWIAVDPKIEDPKGGDTFFSYSISFNHKQNKMEGVRIYANKVKVEVDAHCVQNL